MSKISLGSPKTGKFEFYWKKFVQDIASQDDFKVAHLTILELLCDCLVRYDIFQKVIEEEGFVFIAEGRYGTQIKPRPEVTMQREAMSLIRGYAKDLGVNLKRNPTTPVDDPDDDWGNDEPKGSAVL